jgi:hypothetical protein
MAIASSLVANSAAEIGSPHIDAAINDAADNKVDGRMVMLFPPGISGPQHIADGNRKTGTFVINRKATKALGLEMPSTVLVRADKVIE